MKIDSSRLIQTDQWIDRYGVVLSTISNLANLVMKIGIVAGRCLCSKKLQAVLDESPRKHYWEYLETKEWWSCLLALLPALGNWLINDSDESAEQLAQAAITSYNHDSRSFNVLDASDMDTLWKTEAFALFSMSKNLANFDSVAIERLYRRDFLVKALQQHGDALKQTPRYESLKAQAPDYVNECEKIVEDVELDLDNEDFSNFKSYKDHMLAYVTDDSAIPEAEEL